MFPKMEGGESSRAKPIRLLTLSEQFLCRRNLTACRKCALLALRSHPDLAEADQILAIAEVLTASAGDHPDLYAVLQVEPPCDDTRVIRSHFKRLALLLNPAENKFAFAQEAFDRVTYAWSVLSYPAKKAQYDADAEQKQTPDQESPQRSSGKEETAPSDGGLGGGTFWTVCPYCYYVYEYDRFYEGCCLKCQACMRAFHGVAIAAPPPTIPGKDEYCCCSAYFPMGFITPEGSGGGMGIQAGWPFSPMFSSRQAEEEEEEEEEDSLNVNSENVETREGKKGTENTGMHEHERRGERGEMPYFARPSARNKKTAASLRRK
ncbi:uncharacterized protein LOC131151720 [Malania oleifera]|uniref:uncharacterized protein LOC131151720 n=1 Tax=Malania oleifera TaxID=397392 RepID=UPI0025AEC35D|nr:uncharacterized protein LOC131151720 [Malania oleifera]